MSTANCSNNNKSDFSDLSENDKKVLESILNPYQMGGDVDENPLVEYKEEDLPEKEKNSNDDCDKNINTEARNYELEAIQQTEKGNYDEALKLFAKALEITPEKPSIWNNRAQTYRLIGDDTAALNDLNQSLKLSDYSGRTGCRALCQRGLLKRKNKDDEGAREDFNLAAKLGSKFARTQLVELNPYAALCNQMLKESFEKLS